MTTYGIPVNVLPISVAGEVKDTNQAKWVAKWKLREDSRECTNEWIGLPGKQDILVGRGGMINQHQGNQHLRQVIHGNMDEYKRIGKGEKQKLCARVKEELEATGISFLKQEKSGWYIRVTEKEAMSKLSNSFRNEMGILQRAAAKAASKISNGNSKKSSQSNGDAGRTSPSTDDITNNNTRSLTTPSKNSNGFMLK